MADKIVNPADVLIETSRRLEVINAIVASWEVWEYPVIPIGYYRKMS